jgi:hypothetical protein
MRDMIFACGGFTMTEKEALQQLKSLGCNHVEGCVNLDHVEQMRDKLRTKYMTDLETHVLAVEFCGELEELHYLVGFKIPYHLIHPPKGVQ